MLLTRAHGTHTPSLPPSPQPLCALPSLSPHVPLSPCHQCQVLHGHTFTCAHTCVGAVSTTSLSLMLTLPVCAPTPPGMRDHPPIPITDLADNIERLKANDGLKFSQEYEVRHPHPLPPDPGLAPCLLLSCLRSQIWVRGSRPPQSTDWRGQQWQVGNLATQVPGVAEALPAPQV